MSSIMPITGPQKVPRTPVSTQLAIDTYGSASGSNKNLTFPQDCHVTRIPPQRPAENGAGAAAVGGDEVRQASHRDQIVASTTDEGQRKALAARADQNRPAHHQVP